MGAGMVRAEEQEARAASSQEMAGPVGVPSRGWGHSGVSHQDELMDWHVGEGKRHSKDESRVWGLGS